MAETAKKKEFHFNIGIIVFLMIFVYIIGHLMMSLSKEELAVYQVIQSRIHDSIRTTGLILREETVVKSDNSGYLNYYVNEGEVVAKHGLVYTCDKTGEAHEYISNFLGQKDALTSEDYDEIKELLNGYEDNYKDSKFDYIYDLKYQLENQAMKLGDAAMADHMDEIESQLGSGSFLKTYSKGHGIVTYVEDGYEDMTLEQITLEDFDTTLYEKKNLKTDDMVSEGSSVYRLTTKNDWQIVLSLTNEEYLKMNEKKRVTVYLDDGAYKVTCPVDFHSHAEGAYAILSLTNYLADFVKDRYVEVEVELRAEDGLKIPNTAIVEKEFYKIPKDYMTGNSSAKKSLVIKNQDSKGNVTFKTIDVEVGKTETDQETGITYYYVLKEDVPEHVLLSKADSSDTMMLKETVTLPGVYNINKGYADYRCVNALIENKDYTIVQKNVKNSISLFDRIVLNGNTISNNEIVY